MRFKFLKLCNSVAISVATQCSATTSAARLAAAGNFTAAIATATTEQAFEAVQEWAARGTARIAASWLATTRSFNTAGGFDATSWLASTARLDAAGRLAAKRRLAAAEQALQAVQQSATTVAARIAAGVTASRLAAARLATTGNFAAAITATTTQATEQATKRAGVGSTAKGDCNDNRCQGKNTVHRELLEKRGG